MIKKKFHLYIFRSLLFISSLVISLSVLELGLRITGDFIQLDSKINNKDNYETDLFFEVYNKNEGPEVSLKSKSILCIGDSFTNGGNFQDNWKENYPYHLSTMINKNSNTNIINLGVCEDTTLGVYGRLKTAFETNIKNSNQIKYVVVLVGSADGFHQKAKSEYDNNTLVNPGYHESLITKNWYYNLRIYKMYRHIEFSLKHHYILFTTSKSKSDFLGKKAKEYENAIASNDKQKAKKVLDFTLNYVKENIKYEERLTKQFDFYRDSVEPILFSVTNAHLSKNDYIQALEELIYIIENLPQSWGIYSTRYLVYQIYLKQSQIPASKIIKLLEKYPNILNSKKVKIFYDNFKKALDGEDKLNQEREKLWDKIVELSQKYNFKIIMQNYPSGFESLNKLLGEISKKHNLPLVDNRSVFKSLIAKDGREKYLSGDDHCTDLGYKVMAENVSKKIKELDAKSKN